MLEQSGVFFLLYRRPTKRRSTQFTGILSEDTTCSIPAMPGNIWLLCSKLRPVHTRHNLNAYLIRYWMMRIKYALVPSTSTKIASRFVKLTRSVHNLALQSLAKFQPRFRQRRPTASIKSRKQQGFVLLYSN